MRALVDAMRFTGRATPAGTAGNVLSASTTAPGVTFTATVTGACLVGSVAPVAGSTATFESEVSFTGDSGFHETGTIAFGDDHRLRFSTIGSGYLGPSVDPSRKHGTVMWRVEGGDGRLARATEPITSNFFVDEDLAVIDHHLGGIVLP